MKLIKTNIAEFVAVHCIDKCVPVYHLGFNIKNIPEEVIERGRMKIVLNAKVYTTTLVGVPSVANVRTKLVELIKEYDKSSEVNSFVTPDGKTSWLCKELRTSLKNTILAKRTKKIETTTLWRDNVAFKLAVDKALEFITDLELYASECNDVTCTHLANVEKLQNIEELVTYDFTANYPEKLKVADYK